VLSVESQRSLKSVPSKKPTETELAALLLFGLHFSLEDEGDVLPKQLAVSGLHAVYNRQYYTIQS
jgi:hypothetical protein